MKPAQSCPGHFPTRRETLRAGAIGLLGMGMADIARLRATAKPNNRPRSVIFVFLTGGLSHLDSFDLKPDAPDTVRGEFRPIATRTPGLRISEHLPRLAARSDKWAVCRSIATNSNGHEEACHMLLTGRLDLPAGFSVQNVPNPNEWPSIAAQVTFAARERRNRNLPAAAVLPEPSVNEDNRVRPGQYAGRLGSRWEAWHLQMASRCPLGNGACPHCFRFDGTPFDHAPATIFETPSLSLPDGGSLRMSDRLGLLSNVERQQRRLASLTENLTFDRSRQQAIDMLGNSHVRHAFDVERADVRTVERYGRNKFGLSLLMAKRLVEAGVSMVQVNLGKNSSWDTHYANFVNLRNNLFPYFDRCVSALLDDLDECGMLDDTLVIVTGEFGRTPIINRDAGRDHWGPVMSSLFFGGGVRGGNVIGATDRIGAQPVAERQTPENIAATIYSALGIPPNAMWHDTDGRPYELYRAEALTGLM